MKHIFLFLFLLLLPAGVALAQPPPNDLCANAIAVTIGSSITGTTIGATTSNDENEGLGGITICSSLSPSSGVWYTVVGNGATLTVSTCGGITNFSTALLLFSGTSCGAKTLSKCGVGSCSDGGALLSFPSTAGTTYYICVLSPSLSGQGNFTLSVTSGPLPCPPNTYTQGTTSQGQRTIQVSGGTKYERIFPPQVVDGVSYQFGETNTTGTFVVPAGEPFRIVITGAGGCQTTVTGQ